MTDTNWPNPERPGVPMFPNRDGRHIIGGELLFWCAGIQRWVTNSLINCAKEPSFFTERVYSGPVLTSTQIAEMMAGERERCAKECERVPSTISRTIAQEIRNLGDAP